MRRLRFQAEHGILTCGHRTSTAGEILSHQRHTSIAGGIYRLLHEIVRKLPRTKFYRRAHNHLRSELEFIASASDKILRSMSWRRLDA